MTMPHLQNCDHYQQGWCLQCVGRLHSRVEKWEKFAAHIEKHASMKLPELMQASLLLEDARKDFNTPA